MKNVAELNIGSIGNMSKMKKIKVKKSDTSSQCLLKHIEKTHYKEIVLRLLKRIISQGKKRGNAFASGDSLNMGDSKNRGKPQ